jgi:nitroreductase
MKLIKKIIKRIRNKIKRAKNKFIKNTLPKFCHKSLFMSSLYYFIIDKSFTREFRAVLTGKVKHILETEKTKANYYLLVRNTHRIEKGLLMRPRKQVFAKEYIKETIDSFEGIWSRTEMESDSQMKWFYDVLTEYFKHPNKDPLISKMHKRFKTKIENGINEDEVNSDRLISVPRFRTHSQKSKITYEEFYKLTKHRRSVRWFLDKPVPRELIDKAILAANQSLSACNRQPYEFRIFDDPAMVNEIVSYPMGTAGYSHNIKTIIVVIGNLDAYFDERDRHLIYIDASLACMSFMLALETLGLSSCAINWPDIEARERKMENFLTLEKYQRPLMLMAAGYPDPEGMVAFSEKRSLEKIRKYNT